MKPKLTLVIGPPGSGKTVLAHSLWYTLRHQGSLAVVLDDRASLAKRGISRALARAGRLKHGAVIAVAANEPPKSVVDMADFVVRTERKKE